MSFQIKIIPADPQKILYDSLARESRLKKTLHSSFLHMIRTIGLYQQHWFSSISKIFHELSLDYLHFFQGWFQFPKLYYDIYKNIYMFVFKN